LFYSYRGPITDDPDRDQQLENNLTKALINTLKLGGESVWRPFLTDLGILGEPRDFLLQRGTVPGGVANRRRRLLLGISKQESAWSPSVGTEPTYDSRPDAWVYGDGFAVLVESKVNGDFLPGQMQAHLERLQAVEGSPPEIELRTWKQIHRLFASFLTSLKEPEARLLVGQFIQFLEYSGMSGFIGFRREHFDYFVLHADEDARRWVLEQVEDFATQVQAELYTFAPFYEAYDIGPLKSADSYCWCAFGPRDKTYRDVTHQTMSLSANGLSLFVNAELKAATDRTKRAAAVSPSSRTCRASESWPASMESASNPSAYPSRTRRCPLRTCCNRSSRHLTTLSKRGCRPTCIAGAGMAAQVRWLPAISFSVENLPNRRSSCYANGEPGYRRTTIPLKASRNGSFCHGPTP
jgi:hypothetical protein